MTDYFNPDDDLVDFEANPAEIRPVLDDIRQFFQDIAHPIYLSHGTPSLISPTSIFHVGQLTTLFEDRHFHYRTTPAIRLLRTEGFLFEENVEYENGQATVVWRRGTRYVRRPIQNHVRLLEEYSSDTMNRATGQYAETLTLMGLRGLGLQLVARNTRSFNDATWTETAHDLDFVFVKDGIGYGVEVKNTWDYMPARELEIKLKMCAYLGLLPLS